MYKLGFQNNNCIGCVKGGKWYWNKVRTLFPDVFQQRIEDEESAGHSCIKGVFLKDLKPNTGRKKDEVVAECGAFCQSEFKNIHDKRTDLIIKGKLKISQLSLFNN